MAQLTFDIPEELLAAANITLDEVRERLLIEVIMHLLRQGKINQPRAAELLGVSHQELLAMMAERHIPHVTDAAANQESAAEAGKTLRPIALPIRELGPFKTPITREEIYGDVL